MKLVLATCLLAACAPSDPGPDPDPPAAACDPDVRATKLVTVSGNVIDFSTGAPVAGATVDVGTTLDGTEQDCPVEATLTTNADGTFGPMAVELGSTADTVFVMFRVHGEGRALTTSDNRTCPDAACELEHTIASVSAELGSTWRSALAAGGMPDADTRGLIAFEYREPDATPAIDVVANVIEIGQTGGPRALVPGTEVRYLADDGSALLPPAATRTSTTGWALVSLDTNLIFVGGSRDALSWQSTGCSLEEGSIFLEGRTQGQ
jgi:hypothetical protein